MITKKDNQIDMLNYFIIQKKNIQELVLEVNEKLRQGSECLGSPFQDGESNFNQAMISNELINENKKSAIKEFNKNESFEYFVMIKFKLKKDHQKSFFSEVENYLRDYPYVGLKFCEIYDMENETGEFAFVEFFDNAENYLKAIDRRDNPILDRLRNFVIPYDNNEDFLGSHGKLVKSFKTFLI